MAIRLNPYLSFRDGVGRDAMTFYQSVLGGELAISTFGEFGMNEPGLGDLVMHSQLDTEAGLTVMGSDLPPGMAAMDNGTVALTGDDREALTRYFTGLSEGGTVETELATQMWGDDYGAIVDRFGVRWMFNIANAASQS